MPISHEELEQQVNDLLTAAEHTTERTFKNTVQIIDQQFGEDYAKRNPALVASMINHQATIKRIIVEKINQ